MKRNLIKIKLEIQSYSGPFWPFAVVATVVFVAVAVPESMPTVFQRLLAIRSFGLFRRMFPADHFVLTNWLCRF